MRKDKRKRNNGFSLVELIIVIAILAILGATLAPQLIKYIDKSRKSSDIDKGVAIASAVNIVMADETLYNLASSQTIASLYSATPPDAFQTAVKDHLGTISAPTAKLGSNTDFYINISGTPKTVEVFVASNATDNKKMVYPEIGADFQ